MEKENSIKDLLKPNKCSPLIAYFLIILISISMIINARDTSNNLDNNYKIFNVFKLFTYSELMFLLVLGIVLFGLCQHNQIYLAWIALLFPLFSYLVKNIIVFISLYSIQKSEPPKEEIEKVTKKEKGSSNEKSNEISSLPLTMPPSGSSVMEAQKQMLDFNQAIHNNALQNLQRNSEMSPPLDSIFGGQKRMTDPMPLPTNF
tara:strand:+ start:1478 stop:2086 length:609 start_codon:yes stop_codon:yes gene_type:complete